MPRRLIGSPKGATPSSTRPRTSWVVGVHSLLPAAPQRVSLELLLGALLGTAGHEVLGATLLYVTETPTHLQHPPTHTGHPHHTTHHARLFPAGFGFPSSCVVARPHPHLPGPFFSSSPCRQLSFSFLIVLSLFPCSTFLHHLHSVARVYCSRSPSSRRVSQPQEVSTTLSKLSHLPSTIHIAFISFSNLPNSSSI